MATYNRFIEYIYFYVFRVEEKWFVVSCVNVNKTDWQKGAQAWTCPLDQPPAQVCVILAYLCLRVQGILG